jgi:hypothetical protein
MYGQGLEDGLCLLHEVGGLAFQGWLRAAVLKICPRLHFDRMMYRHGAIDLDVSSHARQRVRGDRQYGKGRVEVAKIEMCY